MDFALDLSHHAWTRDPTGTAPGRTLEIARAADAAGVDAIWVNEDPEGWDAFATLSALAAVTTRAALGTSVTNPYGRHPNLLAASVATLDRISGGRAVLGLGRGQVEWHRHALGVETGSPLAALQETIDLLRAWWAAPHRASSPEGGHFAVHDWERTLAPLQQPVPIYLAAAGPKALHLAGTCCEGVIFNALTSTDVLQQAIPRVRDGARAVGRDPGVLAVVLRTSIVITDDPEVTRKALDRDKTILALVLTLPGMGRLVETSGFNVPAILQAVREAMRTEETLARGGGFPALRRAGNLPAAREAIPDALIQRLGLIGTVPEVRRRLRVLAEIGVTHVSVAPPPDATSASDWRRLLADLRQ